MPKLILLAGGKETTYELDKDVISIGRAAKNDIEIDDLNSSRYHCQIKDDSGLPTIIDLKSRNGTFVNGVLIDRHELTPGDKIEIGRITLFYENKDEFQNSDTVHFATNDLLTSEKSEAPDPPQDEEEQRDTLTTLKKEIEDLYSLLEINEVLIAENKLKKLLPLILDQAIEVAGAERGFLILKEDKKLEIKCSRNLDKELVKKAKEKISHSIVHQVIKNGVPVMTNDAQNDERFTDFLSVHGLKLRSVLCMPMAVGDAVSGVFYLDNRFDEGVFSRREIRILQAFSQQSALAIKIAKLFEENRKREKALEESKKELDETNQQLQEELERQKVRIEAIEKKSRYNKTTTKLKKPPKLKKDYSNIITQSPKMYEIFKVLDKVVDSNVPVLIQGESGTGKELIARSLHYNSKRKKKEFVSENCAAIPENLMESEFFGYEKGAFTGADKRKPGLFEVANKGTLFLDEIAEMNPDMQTKLLRVLQEGEIRRVGGQETINVSVRVISACNKDLSEEIKKKKFREDLFYRLNVITVELPPLRERKEDIPLLVDFFLEKTAERLGKEKREVLPDTMEVMMNYNWPGNIRELENEVERMVALSRGEITPDLLSENIIAESATKTRKRVREKPKTLKDIVQFEVEEIERRVIWDALESNHWKKAQTAEELGVSRPTLDSKIEKYNIQRDS